MDRLIEFVGRGWHRDYVLWCALVFAFAYGAKGYFEAVSLWVKGRYASEEVANTLIQAAARRALRAENVFNRRSVAKGDLEALVERARKRAEELLPYEIEREFLAAPIHFRVRPSKQKRFASALDAHLRAELYDMLAAGAK